MKQHKLKLTILGSFIILAIFYKINGINRRAVYIRNGDLRLYTEELNNVYKYNKEKPSNYLVNSSKCFISDINAFAEDIKKFYKPKPYVNCTKEELLSYVSKEDNNVVLHIREHIISKYSSNEISCCYSYVTRAPSETDPDEKVIFSNCTNFKNNVTLSKNIVLVKCKNTKSNKEVYANVHAFTSIEAVKEKLQNLDKSSHPLSVLLIGIDSISRLNLIRLLPKTRNFLLQNDWIELKGYNKIGDNTFPNLMAIFTGRNETSAYDICKPRTVGGLDECNMLWYDFRDAGLITAYAEDVASINTFDYYKKGFKDPPTDFYFRPYTIACEKLTTTNKPYCIGPETAGERILNLAKDFAVTFKNYSNFGVFWMNSFSHDDLNLPAAMDQKVTDVFEYIKHNGVLENSILIFLSDHGFRFGDITYTYTGWYEERLPFIYFWFPNWFRKKYPKKYRNIKINANRLTTPYDLHMTLQDILVISKKNYTKVQSEACPNCRSLFSEIPKERSCEDASIQTHWCTCNYYIPINTNSIIAQDAAFFILNEIRTVLVRQNENEAEKCADFYLNKIINSRISKNLLGNKTYILLSVETEPLAAFEATVSFAHYNGSIEFNLEGSISRLDLYSEHSYCVQNDVMKKYCYCK